MAKVYVETSFVSACVSTRMDVQSLDRKQISNEWMATQASRHQLLISPEVITELSHPSYPNREAALRLIADMASVPIDREVEGLAAALIAEFVMPGPVGGDALHVAAALYARVEYVLSWNVRHLANVSKVAHLRRVCVRLGYAAPLIVTPDLLWDV